MCGHSNSSGVRCPKFNPLVAVVRSRRLARWLVKDTSHLERFTSKAREVCAINCDCVSISEQNLTHLVVSNFPTILCVTLHDALNVSATWLSYVRIFDSSCPIFIGQALHGDRGRGNCNLTVLSCRHRLRRDATKFRVSCISCLNKF